MQPQLEQHCRRQLRERRATAAGARLGRVPLDRRRVRQAELRAVERHQAPPVPERLGLALHGGARPQHALHQLGEDLPRQSRPPIGQRTVRERRVEQLGEMLAQRALGFHHMKGKGGQHLGQWHARLASWPRRQRGRVAVQQGRPRRKKAGGLRRRDGATTLSSIVRLGMVSHSQSTYRNRVIGTSVKNTTVKLTTLNFRKAGPNQVQRQLRLRFDPTLASLTLAVAVIGAASTAGAPGIIEPMDELRADGALQGVSCERDHRDGAAWSVQRSAVLGGTLWLSTFAAKEPRSGFGFALRAVLPFKR